MKEFFPVLRSSQLFSGVSEEELTAMLTCLGAEKRSFPKEAFLLRSGDTAESIGLVLSSPRRGRARPSLPPMPALPARC